MYKCIISKQECGKSVNFRYIIKSVFCKWFYFKVVIKYIRIFIWLLSGSEYSFLLLLRCFDASIAPCPFGDYPCQYCRSYKRWSQSYSGNKSKYETSTTPSYRREGNIFPVFMQHFSVTSPPSGSSLLSSRSNTNSKKSFFDAGYTPKLNTVV